MDKIKDWAKKNKGLATIVGLAIILFIILLIITIELLLGGSSNKYGDRLDGIDKVKIEDKTYNEVKEEVKNTVLKDDTSVDKAKEIASNTLDNYSKEELSFYDFSFFLEWKGEEKDTVITGNKHHNLEAITWVKS